MSKIFVFAAQQINREPLINFRDLLTEIATARVDDQIKISVSRAINFDEVISAAERADTPFQSSRIVQTAKTIQIRQIEMLLPEVPDIFAGRNVMSRLVNACEVNFVFGELNGVHSATDVNADDVRDGFIGDGHCRSDCATFPRVDVRHYANFAAEREVVIAHAANLFTSGVFDDLCERNCRIKFSANLLHEKILLLGT